MSEHTWVQENLDAYLAGELTTAERDNFENHAVGCEACAAALADSRRLEEALTGLFREARPDAGLEDRLLQTLRAEPIRMRRRPMAWRFAISAAAVLVIGLVGAAMQGLSNGEALFGNTNKDVIKARESHFGVINRKHVQSPYHSFPSESDGKEGKQAQSEAEKYADKFKELMDTDIQYKGARIEDVVVPGTIDPKDAIGIKDGAKKDPPVMLPPPGGFIPGPGKGFGKGKGGGGSIEGGGGGPTGPGGGFMPPGSSMKLPDPFKFDEAQRKKAEAGYYNELDKENKDKEREIAKDPKGLDPTKKFDAKLPDLGWNPTPEDIKGLKLFAQLEPAPAPRPAASYFTPPGRDDPPKGTAIDPKRDDAKPGDDKNGQGKEGGDKGEQKGQGKGNEKATKGGEDAGKPKTDPKEEPKKFPEPTRETNRKIIRTGDMEFEVPKYKNAVDDIRDLVLGIEKNGKVLREPIPGAFIGAENSDTLPNNKTRGSIIVRMPPQYLDTFIRDLENKLGQTGELKHKRIVSFDVTKIYTDIESRLRAARTMEERLIQIIKIGKGEIKDLVAAERELGVWRTKIEEMEGEIRYYANQVALSTLAITITEKEFSAPASLVMIESVRMRVEVENVFEAHQAAIKAVKDLDGILTKSDFKQHPGGQWQSILQAEIPPKHKEEFTSRLKKLGIASDFHDMRMQQTEGGAGKALKLDPKQRDVLFDVTLHDNANVRPRISVEKKIAADNVPDSYDKLLAKIQSMDVKGQVRDARLSDKDKMNITAVIDFNVPIAAKDVMDKFLAALGVELEKQIVRAPLSELSTDRKYGYTITLRDFAAIPPAKSVIEVLSTTDVAGAYAKLQLAVGDTGGTVADARMLATDKQNVSAHLEFTVPKEKIKTIEDLLKTLGTSMSRNDVQMPINVLSTDRKFGFVLVLRDVNSIPAGKASDLKIAVTDVPAIYAKLLEAILSAKGHVADARLNENDKLDVSAQLTFTVPIEQRKVFDEMLAAYGPVLSRLNTQAPINQLSSDKKFGYKVDLLDIARVRASHNLTVTIAIGNVPSKYDQILKALASAKGSISDSKLNEKDKLNISAQITFTVPTAERKAIDDLLEAMGTVLSRDNVQAPASVLSTDRKFGYAVELRDFANIKARETFLIQVFSPEVSVQTSFRDLKNAVAQAKGWIGVANLKDGEAQLNFDVPTAEKRAIEDLFGKAGVIVSRKSEEVPASELATDQKVGYQLTLKSSVGSNPREVVSLKYEVADVDARALELKQMVQAGKGRVIDSAVKRLENGEVMAILLFEVPYSAEETLVRQMGKPISQSTARDKKVPENELTVAHLHVTLTGGSQVVPSDEGVSAYARKSLYLSYRILTFIVMSIIVGLSALVPCGLLLWGGFWFYSLFASGESRQPLASVAPAARPDEDRPIEPTAEPTPKA